jgi:single-strand DNA-binding protein
VNAGDIGTQVVGNLTADPELRYTSAGVPVVNLTVASTPRQLVGGDWRDGRAVFVRCTAWRELAERIVASLHKGDRVVVLGRLKMNEFQTRDGEKRSTLEVDIDEIGASLRYAKATVERVRRAPQAAAAGDEWSAPAFDDGTPF